MGCKNEDMSVWYLQSCPHLNKLEYTCFCLVLIGHIPAMHFKSFVIGPDIWLKNKSNWINEKPMILKFILISLWYHWKHFMLNVSSVYLQIQML